MGVGGIGPGLGDASQRQQTGSRRDRPPRVQGRLHQGPNGHAGLLGRKNQDFRGILIRSELEKQTPVVSCIHPDQRRAQNRPPGVLFIGIEKTRRLLLAARRSQQGTGLGGYFQARLVEAQR